MYFIGYRLHPSSFVPSPKKESKANTCSGAGRGKKERKLKKRLAEKRKAENKAKKRMECCRRVHPPSCCPNFLPPSRGATCRWHAMAQNIHPLHTSPTHPSWYPSIHRSIDQWMCINQCINKVLAPAVITQRTLAVPSRNTVMLQYFNTHTYQLHFSCSCNSTAVAAVVAVGAAHDHPQTDRREARSNRAGTRLDQPGLKYWCRVRAM